MTFQEWLDWWGDDLDRRGVRLGDLQMHRPADSGPYALGNIRKGTPKDNGRTRSHVYQNKAAERTAALLAAERLAGPSCEAPDEEPDPEEMTISEYYARIGQHKDSVIKPCKSDTLHKV